MRARIGRALSGLLILAAGWLGSAAPAMADTGRLVELSVPSGLVPEARVMIWLPPGYDAGTQRYPVIYMQDGQNLFAPADDGQPHKSWYVDRALATLAASGTAGPAIVVGISSQDTERARRYMPAAVYARLPDEVRAALVGRIDSQPYSDAYLRFLVEELKPQVDRDYRTRPDRASTSVMGSSMGGLISLYALAEYPAVFGQAACLSSHWPVFLLPGGSTDLWQAQLIAAWDAYLAERLGPPDGRRIWFDHGTRDYDFFYPPYQQAVDARLDQLGWVEGRDRVSRVYDGTGHNEPSWAARLTEPMGFLLAGVIPPAPPVAPDVAAPTGGMARRR